MHIAIVCRNAAGRGAVANVAVRQAIELAKEFDVTLISETAVQVEGVRMSQVRSREFGFLRRFAHVPNELSFARAAKRRLAGVPGIDFVVCHAHVVAALSALPLKRSRGVPFAIVTHGDIFERPRGTYDPRLTALYKWATPVAYRHADLVVALSPAMAELALLRGARSEAVAVIPNGVDPADIGISAAAEERAGSEAGPLRLLYVGRLAVEKGVGFLIEACRAFDFPFEITIAGSGPLESELRLAAAGLPVRFAGPVPRDQLGRLYAAADVTCVPSISDPFPGVVLESLASGTPVVGTRVGGIPSVIEDGVNGLLVPAGDAVALAAAIASLAGAPQRLAHLRLAAKPTAASFSWDAVGARLREAIAARVTSPR